MKYLIILALLLVTACQPIADHRTSLERAATRTARPIQPLYEGRIRIVLKRPPVDIAPAIAPPAPTVNLVPTVTPTPKASE